MYFPFSGVATGAIIIMDTHCPHKQKNALRAAEQHIFLIWLRSPVSDVLCGDEFLKVQLEILKSVG